MRSLASWCLRRPSPPLIFRGHAEFAPSEAILQDGDPVRLVLNRNSFTGSFATPTRRLSSALCVPPAPFETNCFAAPWDSRQKRSPAAATTASFDISQCSTATCCSPLLYFSATLQNIPAECGLMGQAWHRKSVSLVESLGFAGRLPARLLQFYTHSSEQA